MATLKTEIDPTRIKKAREWARVTGRALSRELSLPTEEKMSQIETGKAVLTPELLQKLATALAGRGKLKGFTAEELLQYFHGEFDLDDPIQRFSWAPRRTGVFQRPMIFRWRPLVAVPLGT